MKIPLLMFCAALLLGLTAATASAAEATTAPKTKTYAVRGFFNGTKPAPALLEKAAVEIGAKMKGAVQVQNPDDADHVVQVLFKRGTYKVYVDALPLDGVKLGDGLDRYVTNVMLAFEGSRENAEGHGRAGSR